jgi:hypothetical protein
MTKKEYEEQDATHQRTQNRLGRKIQNIGDGVIDSKVETEEGDRLQAEAIAADADLLKRRVEEHKDYCAQSDEQKQPLPSDSTK